MIAVKEKIKVMLVDDTPENIKLVERYINSLGHEVYIATNGREAVEQFAAIQPDLILMDVMMPEMDGYEATRRIRELAGERWVPIIFLSALTDIDNLVKGLEAGGDDYLTKPINLRILGAKIEAMQRIAAMQDRISYDALELKKYHAQNEEEKELAREVLDRITLSHELDDPAVHTWCLPAEQLSGDVIGLQRTPEGRIYIMVADATGHGLVAAFSQVPVTQIFYEMVQQGHSVSSIVRRMNQTLYRTLPDDRFVALTVAMLDTRNKLIEVWNGGNPPALVIDEQGQLLRSFRSRHPPVGIYQDDSFDAQTEICNCQQVCQLMLCSDGVLEVIRHDAQQNLDTVLMSLVKPATDISLFESIQSSIRQQLDGEAGPDDITLVVVNCAVD